MSEHERQNNRILEYHILGTKNPGRCSACNTDVDLILEDWFIGDTCISCYERTKRMWDDIFLRLKEDLKES